MQSFRSQGGSFLALRLKHSSGADAACQGFHSSFIVCIFKSVKFESAQDVA